jgi:hypothetical protein
MPRQISQKQTTTMRTKMTASTTTTTTATTTAIITILRMTRAVSKIATTTIATVTATAMAPTILVAVVLTRPICLQKEFGGKPKKAMMTMEKKNASLGDAILYLLFPSSPPRTSV